MITDYLGNEIKEGMEICFIKIIDRPIFSKMHLFVPSIFEGVHSNYESEEIKEKVCFEIERYHKIFFNDTFGLYYIVEISNWTCYQPLEMTINWGSKYTHILAIKGISDNEEMYLNSIKK